MKTWKEVGSSILLSQTNYSFDVRLIAEHTTLEAGFGHDDLFGAIDWKALVSKAYRGIDAASRELDERTKSHEEAMKRYREKIAALTAEGKSKDEVYDLIGYIGRNNDQEAGVLESLRLRLHDRIEESHALESMRDVFDKEEGSK